MTKRGFDLVVALVSLVLLLPLFVVIAVLIRLDSPGPVFFRQERVGRGFRPFRIFKFRSMSRDAGSRGPAITVAGDPRITRVGRVLRRTKLDEVPQLLNVIRGEMSLVGPRPELARFVEDFRSDYEDILRVRPGITDLASIRYRDEGELLARTADPERAYRTRILPDKIRLAREYAGRASLSTDIQVLYETLVRTILRVPRAGRRAFAVAVHLLLAGVANYAAFWLRFDGEIPPNEIALFWITLPVLLAIRGLAILVFRVHEGLWRYAGLWDLRRLLWAIATSTAVFAFVVTAVIQRDYPRSIYAVDSLLAIFLLGGLRFAPRTYTELGREQGEHRVLIVGAGDSGERLARQLLRRTDSEPVGFVDDDELKIGQRIHGIPVLGTVRDLPGLIPPNDVHEVAVAISAAPATLMRDLVRMLEPFKTSITTLTRPLSPGNGGGNGGALELRHLSVEDLLRRPPVDLDASRVRSLVRARRVLITGAGGSIGSELARQIVALQPDRLVLYDWSDNGLHETVNDLTDLGYRTGLVPVIGDVGDTRRLGGVFAAYRPEVVFHAAAHKHVPMMEFNPCEAIKNNVTGTRVAVEIADRHGTDRFILISTDKAVNPSSVMGASKRVAEVLVQSMAGQGQMRMAAVRFGNVLGSSGSVLPRFLEQLNARRAVTVTHPDVQRYFMLIPEAVQLVLHAAALANGGDTFLLDMGEPIRVQDLARHVIRLAGLVPDVDVPITYVGLRPGEKLVERLVADDEAIEPSEVPGIRRIRSTIGADPALVLYNVLELERLAWKGDAEQMLELLKAIVPTYAPPAGPEGGDTALELDPILEPE